MLKFPDSNLTNSNRFSVWVFLFLCSAIQIVRASWSKSYPPSYSFHSLNKNWFHFLILIQLHSILYLLTFCASIPCFLFLFSILLYIFLFVCSDASLAALGMDIQEPMQPSFQYPLARPITSQCRVSSDATRWKRWKDSRFPLVHLFKHLSLSLSLSFSFSMCVCDYTLHCYYLLFPIEKSHVMRLGKKGQRK